MTELGFEMPSEAYIYFELFIREYEFFLDG